MFLYREHRGSLVDSMKTVREMATFSELENHIQRIYGPGEIIVTEYCYDGRIKWKTHIVSLDGRAVGFTNSFVSATNSHVDHTYE